eukprot:TRINITY_DN3297_c0_g1_i2.p1 TRINITY_DN3297_c0_g1~~TRINITY_DN3297_c0_g1_i2.p1  ORF type:complete len:68 (-),score=17.33 TRINITY_DN3297_c0_g1_i2:33-236(-)
MLTKVHKHETWESVIQGEYVIDPLTKEEMGKKLMLEKLHNKHPGFDFSQAEFSGGLPDDPKNFGDFN